MSARHHRPPAGCRGAAPGAAPDVAGFGAPTTVSASVVVVRLIRYRFFPAGESPAPGEAGLGTSAIGRAGW